MNAITRRIGRLEDRYAISSSGKRKAMLRLIVTRSWDGPLDPTWPTCTRWLRAGFLTEVVELNGDDSEIGDEELEKFVASFPVEICGHARAR